MADSKKAKPVEKEEVVAKPERYKGWDMSRVFWGLLLVLIGLLLLLDNFGVAKVHYSNIWQLWPLLVVGWGVSLLNIKGTWWSIVSGLLMIASLGLIAWAAIGTLPFREAESVLQSQQVEKTNKTIERLDVLVEAGAGNIVIGSHESEKPVEASLQSDFATLDIDSQRDGTVQKVDVSIKGSRVWSFGDFRNDLDVQLSQRLPVDLRVKTGASDLDADVSKVMLERLDLDLGANSSEVTLGDLVDLIDVTLDAGASSVTLRVPKSSGVSVKLDKGVSSQNLDGLKDMGSGLYQTAGFKTAAKKIAIRGDLGVSSFTLERY